MKTDRRAFLESLAVVPLVPVAGAPPAAATAGHEAVAEALAEAVKRQFGAHLDADELQAVRKKLLRNLERAERLRKAAGLGNADGPVNQFEAVPPVAKGAER
jgi:hypothetical protein